MLPALLSLGLALGAYLFYDGLTRPRPLVPGHLRPVRLEPWLRQTGATWLTPHAFLLLSAGIALSLGAVAQWRIPKPAPQGSRAGRTYTRGRQAEWWCARVLRQRLPGRAGAGHPGR